MPIAELASENLEALAKGIVNLEKHIKNIHNHGVPVVVTLNSFTTDIEAEYAYIKRFCEEKGCEFALSDECANRGEGGEALPYMVLETLEKKESHYKPLYPDDMVLHDKIAAEAREIYGAYGLTYVPSAKNCCRRLRTWLHKPLCVYDYDPVLSVDDLNMLSPSTASPVISER